MKTYDCVIVGGGVIGLSIAWELAKSGFAIHLVDRGDRRKGTSWAGAGILPAANLSHAHDPIDQLRGLSHQLHPVWSQELLDCTGIDNGYRRCGGIYLATSIGEQATLLGLADYWQQFEIRADLISTEDLPIVEPALYELANSGNLRSAWHVPDEAQIRSPDHLTALRTACRSLGVKFSEFTVTGGRIRGSHLDALTTTAEDLQAEHFCITTGSWSAELIASLSAKADIVPVRGQVLLYQANRLPISRILNEGNRYILPRCDGLLLVGSNEEEKGFEFGTTPMVIDELRQWAEGILAELRNRDIARTWSGLRPASYDGFPYIGKLPMLDNCFVAAGHYRSGLHLSCATAVTLARMMQGLDPGMDMSPFSPTRR